MYATLHVLLCLAYLSSRSSRSTKPRRAWQVTLYNPLSLVGLVRNEGVPPPPSLCMVKQWATNCHGTAPRQHTQRGATRAAKRFKRPKRQKVCTRCGTDRPLHPATLSGARGCSEPFQNQNLIAHQIQVSLKRKKRQKQPYHFITSPVIRKEGDSPIPDMTCKQGPHVRTRPQTRKSAKRCCGVVVSFFFAQLSCQHFGGPDWPLWLAARACDSRVLKLATMWPCWWKQFAPQS